MNTLVHLHLQNPQLRDLTLAHLHQFSSFLLNYTTASLTAFEHGELLYQTFSNYLICIELFDYKIVEDISIDVDINQSGFFMAVMLQGDSATTDPNGATISETGGNCTTMSHVNAGNYKGRLSIGKHSVLLITFKQEWFLKTMENVETFAPLITSYMDNKPHYVLPHCAIARSIFNGVANMQLNEKPASSHESDIVKFVERSIASYCEKLFYRQYDARTFKRKKLQEFADFIKENYTQSIVEDLPALAARFNTSEKGLARIAAEAFGKPLHKQVMEYRLLQGLKLLMLSDQSIQEIAWEVGFTDQRYFSRVFKKHFGVMPKEVRLR